jgi:hypothetical protein
MGPTQGGHLHAMGGARRMYKYGIIIMHYLWHERMLARSSRGGADLFNIQLWFA